MSALRHLLKLAIALGCCSVGAAPAAAERIIASMSLHRVLVTSNFTGTQITLFGAIERDHPAQQLRPHYDVVVTVTGPRQNAVIRRKGRVLGIWANVDSRTFVNVPIYLAVLTNRPIDALASTETARRLQIGLKNIQLPQQIGPDVADVVPEDPFRANFLRLKTEQQLYSERTNGVTFLTPTLFRADIPLPPNAPIGNYDVDVKLLFDGNQITRTRSAFELVKIGFEQFVAEAAHKHGLLYGLATALMAFLTGWFASVVFRRD
jgi:uncharacterized protein (TIGR02186 family)